MTAQAGDDAPTRRDFLYIATGATGAVALGATVWPLIDQMNPDASVRALSSIEIDVSGLEPGMEIREKWQGKPVFIRRRTPAEIEASRAVDLATLPDQDARNSNLADGSPASDENRVLGDDEWLVLIGVCTHLGCVPIGDGAGDFKGWYCPCHGSHYDSSGRIRKGPAPANLPVPPATFVSEGVVRIG